MNANLCAICKAETADFACLCQFPLTHYCSKDIGSHQLKPLSGITHRIMHISQRLPATREEYDLCIDKAHKLERVSCLWKERVKLAENWVGSLDEICFQATERIQEVQKEYRGKLAETYQTISEKVDASMNCLADNIANPDFHPDGELTREGWDYMTGQKGNFEGKIGLDSEPSDWLAKFRESVQQLWSMNVNKEKEVIEGLRKQLGTTSAKVEELTQALNNERKKFEERLKLLENQHTVEIQRIRAHYEEAQRQIQNMFAQDMAETNRKWDLMLRRDDAWWESLLEKAKLSEVRQLAPLMCLCWPAVGLTQMLHYEKQLIEERSYRTLAKAVGTFFLPTCLCCVGAAINRQLERKRRGVKGSFAMDVSLYCIHTWNACLLAQEKDTKQRIP